MTKLVMPDQMVYGRCEELTPTEAWVTKYVQDHSNARPSSCYTVIVQARGPAGQLVEFPVAARDRTASDKAERWLDWLRKRGVPVHEITYHRHQLWWERSAHEAKERPTPVLKLPMFGRLRIKEDGTMAAY